MLRSLYSGVSGLKNYQTQLDVIGNNIANVGTAGFKKGRANFSDLFSQEVAGAKPPIGDRGGQNPSQIGLGSQIGSIDTIDTQGNVQTTGRTLDLMIQGNGYFQLQDNGETYYTRAGNFYLDNQNNLVNADGLKVQGTNGDITINKNAYSQITIGTNGDIVGIPNNSDTPVTLARLNIATFNNPDGLSKFGGSLFRQTSNSGTANTNIANNGQGEVRSGALEMSNVDLTDEFTGLITSQRGYQANARVITTADQILQELTNLKRN